MGGTIRYNGRIVYLPNNRTLSNIKVLIIENVRIDL